MAIETDMSDIYCRVILDGGSCNNTYFVRIAHCYNNWTTRMHANPCPATHCNDCTHCVAQVQHISRRRTFSYSIETARWLADVVGKSLTINRFHA